MNIVIDHLANHSDTWLGHCEFAKWLVCRWERPEVVDLGVDYGLSTFAFATSNPGARVTGIDCFVGDEQSGFRDTEQYVRDTKRIYKVNNLEIIKGYFDDQQYRFPPKTVDILHIDGLHTYEAVKHDYNTWKFSLRENGVVLFHDTRADKPGFGVDKFFDEIDLPKLNFSHYYGLGVVTRNKSLLEEILDAFPDNIDYYYNPGA